MKTPFSFEAVITATAFLGLAGPVGAHSWVEYAYKLAQNGTMIGDIGFARGYLPRNSTDPPFTDTIPQNILPQAGQPYYSGDEILNKYKFEENPEFPMLEASAGDYVAIMHLENGHTTLPENQPNKPKNRGTIYFYGTTQPKENEKLFDVHLLWNKDGTGGDGRGKLLATRNYDDGQCYQPNSGGIASERATELAALGATLDQELACQSDIKLPDDLQSGDVYTIYWYWDWPDLNREAIDFEATKNGLYPWAGTFMRGEKDPNGFTMDAIAKNESYSSVIDIKITGASEGFTAKEEGIKWVPDQNIYSMGIEEQMRNNYQVDVDGGQGGDAPASQTATPSATSPEGGSGGSVTTVTMTKTVAPPVSFSTVYVTVPADQFTAPGSSAESETASTTTVTFFSTRSAPASTTTATSFVTRSKSQAAESPSTAAQETASTTTKTAFVTRSTPQPIESASAAPSNAISTVSFPGGQFRETPVSITTEGVTPTQPANAGGPPQVSPFLRIRGVWDYRNL